MKTHTGVDEEQARGYYGGTLAEGLSMILEERDHFYRFSSKHRKTRSRAVLKIDTQLFERHGTVVIDKSKMYCRWYG